MSLAEISLDNISINLPSSPSSAASSSRCGSAAASVTADSDTDEDRPGHALDKPGSSARPLVSLRASLQVPPSTTAKTAPPGVGGAPSTRLGVSPARSGGLNPPSVSSLRIPPAPDAGHMAPPPTLNPGQARAEMPTGKRRTKVALAPGCSALDWARLKTSQDLRGGVTSLLRVTPSELKKHKTPDDCWSAFNNKVYNLTPYLRFHPGGEKELMRVAGRDGTRLFMLTHSWVNIDAIMDSTIVGVLVKESTDDRS